MTPPRTHADGSPVALIRRYWGEVWNERQPERIRAICRDPIVRHDPSCVSPLTHEEQIARVRQQSERMHPFFTHEVLLGDDRFVCSVWNMFTRGADDIRLSGIEVFEARDGLFTDCWNSSYSKGFWNRAGGDPDPLVPRTQAGGDDGGGVGSDPAELVRRFFDARATGDCGLLSEIVADGLVRYVAGGHDAVSIDALLADAAAGSVTFDALFAEGDYACAVWNLQPADPAVPVQSGIDVFRQSGGRLVEWWSPPRTVGAWGREGDAAVIADLPPPALLASVDAIDETWLQAVFQHAGVVLPRISLLTPRPIGHGNLSDTVRVAIGYNKPVTDEITSVVCKFNSNYPAAQALAAAIAPYRAEACAYRHFGLTPPMRTARAYHADCSDDGLIVNLVLEDLGAFCEPGDQVAGCSVADAAAVTHELARMHAHYWNAPDLRTLPWMAINRAATGQSYYDLGVAVFEERYAAIMGAADMAVIRGFAPLVEVWRGHAHRDVTLIHADPRVDNVMFDRRGADPLAYLIDWQMVGWGSPARDLAYFLTGSLSIDDRRACEQAMIADHARAVAAIDPSFTETVARDAYRIEAVSGLHATIGAAAVMPDTPHNRDLLIALAMRNVSAVRDWDTLGRLAALA